MNVNNRQLKIAENCPENIKESILKYWEFENENFLNKPNIIAKSIGMYSNDLYRLVKENSELYFEVLCTNCDIAISNTVNSQTGYTNIVKQKEYICQSCEERRNEERRLEAIRKQEEALKPYLDAVENRHWEQLSTYEFSILHNIAITGDTNAFLRKYQGKKSNHFFNAIYKLKRLHLIELKMKPFKMEITNIKCYQFLINAIPPIQQKEETINEDTSFNHETNELRFKLTKNPNPFSYDSPEYSGTLEFKQTVVLKPGIEYSFGAWRRQNDALYLTIIPTKDKSLLPRQKNKEW